MSNLKSTIEDLASDFALSIIGALRAASSDELTNVAGLRRRGRAKAALIEGGSRKRGRGGRLGRRSTEDIGRMVDSIVELLGKHDEGLRAEQIREALGVQAKELPRPLSDALSAGRIRKDGQKRATTYFLHGDGSASATPKKRRAATRAKRKRG
jgi:hypothetical protein